MALKRLAGNFATYALEISGDFPPDEEAVEQAFDHMFSMCGNSGQESMMMEVCQEFSDWALSVLEDEEAQGTDFDSFLALLMEWYKGRGDKVSGTQDIYAEGWQMIAEQSGYRDQADEAGEGAGQRFG